MSNHFMNITISAANHLAQSLITQSIWQTVENSESFGLTQGTHLALLKSLGPSSKKRPLMEAAALVSTPHFMPAIQAFMVIIKQGQMDGGVSSKRSKNTEWHSLVYCCKCCHLPVSSATAGVYACSMRKQHLALLTLPFLVPSFSMFMKLWGHFIKNSSAHWDDQQA